MHTASAPTLFDAANQVAGPPLLGAIGLGGGVVCVVLASLALAVESARQGRTMVALGWGVLTPSTAVVIAFGPILGPLSLSLH
ncbi:MULTISPECIES: hypothetical protein [Mycobacterium]|uniref:Uncharacterized protein n=2 Tax=Mycobacterium TaxID=1763 RepID=D5P558_9MYCO|nr:MULTISPECIES: hypothetical protein [Mycobacterium]EFG78799.1 hypothetical protein HMPREF0591_1302 [Mycobacterium parascrofulaceum ATCC BAA-614]AGZ54614.1 hypothetical protein MKAN_29390 [Mycobacterium kansasii ATCC 12478]ASL12398.1 hypothetical protein MYCODSM44623_05725 [Mycobacterium intracellulare subsp. chimaera]ASL24225.1 hypothetical protein MYCOZU1_05864 [Mycobacterium intracellulare subsp. chimaera]MCA2311498.1 hypothetical protein [Mycobacterium intracellulare subsp. chimaera]